MKKWSISAFTLHILAMAFMLSDHLWATVVPGHQWMTGVGRLAFPIFAFMIVEGYYHTHDLKKYMLRLLVWALLTEIPFDLMYGSTMFYPYHQNVLWTFLISLCCIAGIEHVKKRGVKWQTAVAGIGISAIGIVAGFVGMVDYYGFGVMTVLVFYLFRGRKWYHYAGQLVSLYYIHAVLFAGLQYPVTLFGWQFEIPHQGLALLSLIPIWLYKGEQGPHNKKIQFLFYAFYPVHMAILAAIVAAL